MGRAEAIVKCDAAEVSDRMLGECKGWNGEEGEKSAGRCLRGRNSLLKSRK
jgi:hypothetical protein